MEYGGKLRNIIDFNPKRRRKNLHDEDNEEDEEEEDPEREPLEDDSWAYGQVNVKGFPPFSLLDVVNGRSPDTFKSSLGISHASCIGTNIQKQQNSCPC